MNHNLDLIVGSGAIDSSRFNIPKSQKIAIDYDGEIAQTFHRRNQDIPTVIADATHLPFSASTFDEVEATHILEHLPEAESKKALDEIARVVVTGGEITLAVPHPTYDNLLASIDPAHHSSDMHQQVLDGDGFSKLVANAGLNIIDQSNQNWQQAVKLLLTATVHRLSPNLMGRHNQIGYVATDDTKRLTVYKNILKKIISALDKLSPVLNKIIPYETVIHARK